MSLPLLSRSRFRFRLRSLIFILFLLFLLLFFLHFYSLSYFIPKFQIPKHFTQLQTQQTLNPSPTESSESSSSSQLSLLPPYYYVPSASFPSVPLYPPSFPPAPPRHILQYHLLPVHLSPPSSSPLITPSSAIFPPSNSSFLSLYPTINLLGLIPQFHFLHPPDQASQSALFFTIYEIRYDNPTGYFHLLTFLHCSPNTMKPSESDDFIDSYRHGCRLKGSTGESFPLQPQLEMESIREEMEFIASSLTCKFSSSEIQEENFFTPPPIEVRARLRLQHRSPAEILCLWPGFPSHLPSNHTKITLIFRNDGKFSTSPYKQENYNKDSINKELNSLRSLTNKRQQMISIHSKGLYDYPIQFTFSFYIYTQFDPFYNIVHCSAPIHSNHYIRNLPEFYHHYMYIGIEHFELLDRNNLYYQAIKQYIDTGIVTYKRTPEPEIPDSNPIFAKLFPPSSPSELPLRRFSYPTSFDQIYQLESCRYRYYYSSKWLGLFDYDEFLVFPNKKQSELFSSSCITPIQKSLKLKLKKQMNKNKKQLLYQTIPSLVYQLDQPRLTIEESLEEIPFTSGTSASKAAVEAAGLSASSSLLTPQQYASHLFIPCRSLLTDLFIESTDLLQHQFPSSARSISISTTRATVRSPEFWNSFRSFRNRLAPTIAAVEQSLVKEKQRQRKNNDGEIAGAAADQQVDLSQLDLELDDENDSHKDSLKEFVNRFHTKSLLHSFDYPLLLTFTYSIKMQLMKSFFLINSPCRVELHVPRTCNEEDSIQYWNRDQRWNYHTQQAQYGVLDRKRVVFLHFQNIVGHRQMLESGETEVKALTGKKRWKGGIDLDRLPDPSRALWEKKPVIFDGRRSDHQGEWAKNYLDPGEETNKLGAPMRFINAGRAIHQARVKFLVGDTSREEDTSHLPSEV
jgi:hypothetical protein